MDTSSTQINLYQEPNNPIWRSKWLVFACYAIALFIFRWSFFEVFTLNPDEITYLLVARDWFNGDTLYEDVIDIKPPGVYLLLGLFQKIGLDSIISIRVITTFFLAGSALLINLIARKLDYNYLAAFFAGLTFCVFFVAPFTLSTNTEHYFTFLNLVGLYILLRSWTFKNTFWGFFFVGIAITVKQIAFFDAIAFVTGLILFYDAYKQPEQLLKHAILAIMGICLPHALMTLYFILFENFEAFAYYNFIAPVLYSKIRLNNTIFTDFIFWYKYFIIYSIIGLLSTKINFQKVIIPLIWLATTLIAVAVTGKGFDHYLIQVFPALALLTAYSINTYYKALSRMTMIGVLSFLLMVTTSIDQRNQNKILPTSDYPEVYRYLKMHMDKDDRLFCGNYHHISYYLLEKESPTPYIHHTVLYKKIYYDVFQVDTTQEINHIIEFNPDWVTTNKDYPLPRLQKHIAANYTVTEQFNDIKIWRRNED